MADYAWIIVRGKNIILMDDAIMFTCIWSFAWHKYKLLQFINTSSAISHVSFASLRETMTVERTNYGAINKS